MYHHFQTPTIFANLIPFIYIRGYKFETIIQNPCLEGFDQDHFVQKLWAFKIIYYCLYIPCFFFLSGSSFTDTDDSQDSRGREGTIFYSTLPLPPAHKHWDIYLQLCMWDDYHVFLIAMLVFTRLLLDEIYHLIELPFEWLIDDAIFVC